MKQPVARKARADGDGLGRNIIPQELLNLTPNFIAVLDIDGTIVELNSATERLLCPGGKEPVTGELFYDYCFEGERQLIQQGVTESIHQCGKVSLITKLKANDGSIIDVELSLS